MHANLWGGGVGVEGMSGTEAVALIVSDWSIPPLQSSL